ncbi:hypothetical protein Tco_1574760, partial [Tanacetum coccineum]
MARDLASACIFSFFLNSSDSRVRVCLLLIFPRLYAFESYKDIYVADKIRAPLYTSFRRDVRGGAEASQLAHLSALLATVTFIQSEDRWTCDLNGEGVFRIKDVRNLLDEHFLPNAG